MRPEARPPAYEFGPFRLDPAERLLLRGGQPVALTPKAFDLLVYLVERPNRLIDKHALMSALWPDVVVEESNLAYTVSALRKALGDAHEGEQFIQTVPTRGYRFVAPVRELSSTAPSTTAVGDRRRLIGAIVAALAVGALIGAFATRRLGPSLGAARPIVRFEIPASTGLRNLSAPAISPDGLRVVFVSATAEGPQLHVRALDSLGATPIPGTADARQPFFSPDGRSIGFGAGEFLVKLDVATGVVTNLCPVTRLGRGATWGADGRIYFSPGWSSGISVVPSSGGRCEPLTTLAPGDVAHGWPDLLPDGRHLLFTRWETEILDDGRVEVLSLRDGQRRTVLEGAYGARYVPTGHLLYVRRDALMAVPFEPSSLKTSGAPVRVLEGIAFSAFNGQPLLGVSRAAGTLAYFPGGAVAGRSRMVWVDARGHGRAPLDAPPGFYVDPVLSPDGRRLAVAPLFGTHQDIWVGDLTRGTWTRVTVNPRGDAAPVWRPDDPGAILFTMAGPGAAPDLFSIPADGSHAPELVYESPYPKFATSSCPAAGLVAFTEVRPDTKADLWLLRFGGGKPAAHAFLQTPFSENSPALSPDGRWLAYESDESGRPEIYVKAVSGAGARWQVSPGGGDRPRWSRDGQQIVYRHGNTIMAARVATGESFTAERPRALFEGEFESGGHNVPNYDVSADGGRFLMIEPVADRDALPSRLVVIENWFSELLRKLPRI